MELSVKTVENHLTRLYRQLDVQSRLEAVNHVMQHPEVLGISGQAVVDSTVSTDSPAQEQINQSPMK